MPTQWNDALLRLTLRGGNVYYLQHRAMTSVEPHYFVVLNLDPLGDELLIMLVASSKIDKVKWRNRNLPEVTLVEIEHSEYREFSVPSIIDCNRCFRFSKHELLQKLQQQVAIEKTSMPPDIIEKIRAGVIASPLVEFEVKDKLR